MTEEEEFLSETMIKRRSTIHFETVDYDNLLFKDYVITQEKKDKNGIDTESGKRLVAAFDYFNNLLKDKSDDYCTRMLKAVTTAVSTTHEVSDESEAIQMFIFQNNRGKNQQILKSLKPNSCTKHICMEVMKKKQSLKILKNVLKKYTNLFLPLNIKSVKTMF
ncbi:hypothetical protein FPS14_contig00004-0079 [Flavobacterium psychrophilum]|nr:hypothetical protein FPS14_contig00004-0079 [Flavobacterium psychrophilum]